MTVMIYIQDEGDRVEPLKLNVVDAFKKFDASEEEKNNMLGYITRAKMNDKDFSSLHATMFRMKKTSSLFVIAALI